MSENVGPIAAILAIAAIIGTLIGKPSEAAVPTWRIGNIAESGALNVRRDPTALSPSQGTYGAGTRLMLTGTCRGPGDATIRLADFATASASERAAAVRYAWCQVRHDPERDGRYTTGWVYGRYLVPN